MRSSAAFVIAVALTTAAAPVKNPNPKDLELTSLTRRYTYLDSREVRLALRSPTETGVLNLHKRHCEPHTPEPRPQDPDGEGDGDKPEPEDKPQQAPNPFPDDDGGPVVTPKPGSEPSGQPTDNGGDDEPQPDPQPQEPEPEPQPEEQPEPQEEPTPSGGGDGSSNPHADAYVNPHNEARARYNANPVGWDENLAAIAQKWANGCNFEHSGGSLADFKYGENLAAGTGDYQIGDAVHGWVSEENDYEPSNPEKPGVGHFTQVVWKETTTIGCAFADCPAGTGPFGGGSPWRYHSCVYTPPGNWVGEYEKNVG